MKKLLFIASVGLLFSCSNGAGTCTCTSTVTIGGNTSTNTNHTYYETDAQEKCEVDNLNMQQINQYSYCELE